jgi:hypothetical protein
MIHFNAWFNLKPGVPEAEGIAAVARFLGGVSEVGDVAGFQILVNKAGPPTSKLPRYHALVRYRDDAHFAEAMRNQVQRGIHSGPHGRMTNVITDFHVEVFSSLGAPVSAPQEGLLACGI